MNTQSIRRKLKVRNNIISQIKLHDAAVAALRSVVLSIEEGIRDKTEFGKNFHDERSIKRQHDYTVQMESIMRHHIKRIFNEEPFFKLDINDLQPVFFGNGLKILNPITELHEAI